MSPRSSFSIYRAVAAALADAAIMNIIPIDNAKTTMGLYFIRPLLYFKNLLKIFGSS